MIKLKPCPFCGGKAVVVSGTSDKVFSRATFYIHCVECNVSTETFVDGDRNLEALLAAIAVWNRRMEDGD